MTTATEAWADLFDAPPVDVEATYQRLLETMAPAARYELGRLLLGAERAYLVSEQVDAPK